MDLWELQEVESVGLGNWLAIEVEEIKNTTIFQMSALSVFVGDGTVSWKGNAGGEEDWGEDDEFGFGHESEVLVR